ncbi:MAG TPA: acyl-CoA dehydrogenase family protein [Actinomycetota bacterium]|jgi:alkylation response protein AidB-like acyl-CoA dehydrogenase|nr:acyl-CoA dehydrogenase family protein [Actinomycetota bacterium]
MALIELTDTQKAIIETVRDFVEKEVIPVADEMEHRDEFPDAIVEQMKELGLFGLNVPEEHGGIGESLTTYALCVVELARGWMSLSGVLNTHFMGNYLINKFGTPEQKEKYLPRMATGELRAALAMSEPEAGSDVQAIRTRAVRDGDDYVVNGQKMWLTNGLRSGIVMTLVKTDATADPPHKGMSMLIVEKTPGEPQPAPGLDVGKNIEKMGYKGVETTEMTFNDVRVPAGQLLGTEEGQGFRQVLDGIEIGRVNVAARAVGVSTRAFEEAIKYAQERKAFGKTIAQHQAIQIHLAEMATQLEAARLLLLQAAQKKDAGERSDLEAGMAKLFASEACHEICLKALRVHGGYGYSKEFTVERLYRDAPFLLIGEGTSEIQKQVIARRLLERHKIS